LGNLGGDSGGWDTGSADGWGAGSFGGWSVADCRAQRALAQFGQSWVAGQGPFRATAGRESWPPACPSCLALSCPLRPFPLIHGRFQISTETKITNESTTGELCAKVPRQPRGCVAAGIAWASARFAARRSAHEGFRSVLPFPSAEDSIASVPGNAGFRQPAKWLASAGTTLGPPCSFTFVLWTTCSCIARPPLVSRSVRGGSYESRRPLP